MSIIYEILNNGNKKVAKNFNSLEKYTLSCDVTNYLSSLSHFWFTLSNENQGGVGIGPLGSNSSKSKFKLAGI